MDVFRERLSTRARLLVKEQMVTEILALGPSNSAPPLDDIAWRIHREIVCCELTTRAVSFLAGVAWIG